MSTTIDTKVVEMRFDNRQFENNVSTTMSTLDKLKQKLNLDGASKGLENVSSAAGKVDMSSLSNGVENVRMKFSALEVVGVTALANITNSAVNAGKNLVKSLSVDQIASGWNKYGQKTASVQTIMNATGKSIDEVNTYLDKLMWFSDETSYGFTDMTAALGQMTSAGGDIDKLIPLITGVANATAFAGKGATEFSRVMYNLNQSYSKGFLDYSDWKSIDLAGVSSKQLKQMIIDVAVAQGKIKEGEITLANFANTLKDKWADTSVIEDAFGKFAEMSEKAYEMVQAGEVDTASEAYEILAEQYDGIAITAAKAAQEAKTFQEAIDATKDAVSSGWMKTFELIFGNYDEAKVMWTDLANVLWDMFASGAEGRNEFLAEALDSNWDKLVSNLTKAGIKTEKFEESIQKIVGEDNLSTIIEEFGSLEEAVKNGAISSDDLKKALDGVESPDLSGLVNSLKEITRMLDYGDTGEDVKKLQTALKELGYDIGKFGENADGIDGVIGSVTEKAIKEFQKANGLVVDGIAGPKTLAALEKAAEGIGNATGNVDELMAECDSLIDVITNPGGRELIFESIINVLEAIQIPIAAVKEAFSNVFSLTPDNLYNGLKKINSFTKSLLKGGILDTDTWDGLVENIEAAGIDSNDFTKSLSNALKENEVDVDELIEKYGSLGKAFEEGAISTEIIRDVLLSFEGISETLVDSGETIDKIRRSFEGLFAAIDIVATVLSGPAKIAFNVIKTVLGKFGLTILDVTANVGDSIVEFRDNIDGVITSISDFISEHVTKWLDKFEETEVFKNVARWFTDAGDSIEGALSGISGKVNEFNLTPIGKALQTVANFISSTAKTVGKSKIFTAVIDGIVTAFDKLKNFFKGFKLPEFNLDNIRNFFDTFILWGENIGASGKTGIAGALSGLGTTLKGKFITPKLNTFITNMESFFSKFVGFWLKIGDKVKQAFGVCADALKAVAKFLFGTEEINLPTIMAAVEKFLWIVTLLKAIQLMDTLVSPFENITAALKDFASARKWDAIGDAFKAMTIALGVLTVCIVIIASLPDMNKAWQAAGMLAAMLIVMGGIIVGLGILSSKIGGLDIGNIFGIALSLLLVVGAIALMVKTLKDIDDFKLKDPVKTFGYLAAILLALTVGIKMIAKAGGANFKSIAAILTLVAALKLILDVIAAYDEFDWVGKSRAIEKMMEMLLGISIAANIASRGVKDGGVKGLALVILAMVVSLKILLGVIEDFAAMPTETLIKGGLVVTALLGIMAGMAYALNKSGEPKVLEKGQKSANNFTGLAVTLLAVVAAIWLLGKMDTNTLVKGGIAVAAVLALMTGVVYAVGKSCSGLKTGTVVAMLIMFAVLLAELAIIIKVLDGVSWQSKISTVAALAGMLLAMAGALRMLSTCDVKAKVIYKWIGALAVLGILVYGLTHLLRSMQDIEWQRALGNAGALATLILAMSSALMVMSNSKTMNWKKMGTVLISMATLTAILLVLTQVLRLMKTVDPLSAIGHVTALSILLNAMSSALLIMSQSKFMNWKKMGTILISMTALSAILLVLTQVLRLMKTVDPMASIGHVTALSILLNAMASALLIMSQSKFMNWKKMGTILISMTALSAILLVLTQVLRLMKTVDPVASIGHVTALSILLNAMSSALLIMSQSKFMNWKQMGTILISMTALSAILLVLTQVLRLMKTVDPMASIGHVTALSILLNAMASALLILSYSKSITIGAMLGMVGMAAVLYILVPFLHLIDGMVVPIGTAISLSILLNAMAVAMVILSTVQSVSAGAIIGMLALSVVVGVLGLVMAAIVKMKCEMAISTAISLSIMLLTMTTVFVILGLTGSLASTAIMGAVGLVAVIAIIGAAVIAIGALMSAIPQSTVDKWKVGFENFMDFLVILAEGLGEMIGSALGGAIVGFTENLITAGENLKKFADSIADVPAETVSSMKTLCEAIAILVGANLLDTLADWLIPGDNGISSFVDNIGAVADGIKKAAEGLKGITDEDVENINRAATAGVALADLNSAIPKTGGLWQSIAGESDLAEWGKKIVAFADSLVNFSIKVSGKSINKDAIIAASDAAKAVSDLNNGIPKAGGLWQEIAGEQDLASWGRKIVAFGTSLVNYSKAVSGGTIDKQAIIDSCAAATELAKLNDAIPESDGVWQWITGEKDLSTFGTGLTDLAEGLLNYATKASQIQSIGIEPIKHTGTLIDEIKTVCEKLPKIGFDWGKGIHDPHEFGAGINALADGLYNFCTKAVLLNTLGQTAINGIQFAGTAIDELKLVVEKIPEFDNMKTTVPLHTAASNLKGFCEIIHAISTAGYVYTGIDSVKTAVGNIESILTGEKFKSVKEDAANLKATATSVKDAASTFTWLNDQSYGGVAVLNTAIDDLAAADVDGILSTFQGKAGSVETAVKGLVNAMVRALDGAGKTDVTNSMIGIVNSAITTVTNCYPMFEVGGNGWGITLSNGITSAAEAVKSAAAGLADQASSGVSESSGGMTTAGNDLGQGLVNGINAMSSAVYWAGYALGQKAVQGENDGQASASPSKLTIQSGKWLGEGLVIGMDKMSKSVYNAGYGLGETATDTISSTISRISDMVSSDIDSQPTIRPVMDLSDVESGVSAIGSMLDMGSSIGVRTNIGAISSMMNNRSQNGANADVVSAIDKLNKKMDNIQNASYHINGITYDDGSNITDAVATLVRAARIERRM